MGSYHKSMLLIKQAELKLYGYVFSYGLGSFCVQGKIRSPLSQKEPGCYFFYYPSYKLSIYCKISYVCYTKY